MADRFRRPPRPNDTSSGPSRRDPFVEQLREQLRPIASFFREHPAIVGTLLYLQVTTVGVIYSWALFRRFGINVFDYAEANDFLLAAFKEPFVFGMSTFTLIFLISFANILIWRRKTPADETPADTRLPFFFRTMRRLHRNQIVYLLVLTILYTLGPPLLFANFTADSLQSPSYEPLTSVQYRATSGSDEQTTQRDLRVIGTTQSFVFFYDKKDSRTLIIPSAQIVEMKQTVTKD